MIRGLWPFGADGWVVFAGASLFIPSFAALGQSRSRVDLSALADWPKLFKRLSVEMGFQSQRTSGGVPLATTLANVVCRQERYEGERIQLQGVVRTFTRTDGIRYMVLEDNASNRVLLKPTSSVAALNGVVVCVEGRFSFAHGVGRVLDVDTVRQA